MKKNRIRQVSLIVVSMMLLSLLGSGTIIAGEPGADESSVATVTIEAGVISWGAQVENGGMVLTIAGPGDFYLQQEYESGAYPTFKPVDGRGNALPDGVYKYELVLLPAKWEAPAEYDEAQRGLESSEGTAAARVQSGSFSILDGGFVTPQAEEGRTEGKIELGEELTDQVILDDLIVDGSACIGWNCVNGESFGFDTLRLKEDNLRIKFQDTSSTSSFPTNDWQITANDSANGGANKFSIDDIDSGRTPFTIEAGTRANALYVDDSGRVGLGTSTPAEDLHIWYGDTPTIRLHQSGSGWAPQTWDVAGNEANFFIRDVTNGSTLPFRIRPGAQSSSIDIMNNSDVQFVNNKIIFKSDGKVGIGTWSPGAKLEIDQGGDDDEILTFSSSDVNHGITDNADSDTWALFQKATPNTGGMELIGFSEAAMSFRFWGAATAGVTGKSASDTAVINLRASKKSGTSLGGMGTNENLVSIQNHGTTVALFDKEGDLHLDGGVNENAWDEYDDALLIRAARVSLMPVDNPIHQQFQDIIEESKPILEKYGLVTYNEDGDHFLAMRQWTMLLADGVWQLAQRLDESEAQNAELEERVAALEALVTSLVQGQKE